MNERERKEFEVWAYSNKWNIFRVRDMGLDHYVDEFVDAAWHGWKASANREGYKLVPVEPTYDMYDAFYNEHDKYAEGDVKPFKESYKAMIGVVDNQESKTQIDWGGI